MPFVEIKRGQSNKPRGYNGGGPSPKQTFAVARSRSATNRNYIRVPEAAIAVLGSRIDMAWDEDTKTLRVVSGESYVTSRPPEARSYTVTLPAVLAERVPFGIREVPHTEKDGAFYLDLSAVIDRGTRE